MTLPIRLAFLLLLGLGLAHCGGAQQPPPPPRERTARDYFPLRTGAAWSFDSTDVDHGGTPGLVVMRVVRDDGAGGFYMQQGRGAPALYEYASGGVTRNGEVVLADPLRAGNRWRGLSGDGYVIRAVGLTRTVPAGTFHDVVEVVRTAGEATLRDGTEYRETYYYAPNVGPIEATIPIMVAPGDVRRFHLVLRGYTLTGEL